MRREHRSAGTGTEAESELLEAARAGDTSALDGLLQRQVARIHRFAMNMCRNPEDAQDIVQDTLLAAARGIRDFRGESTLSTWLFTIARSFCAKRRRRRKFEPEAVESLETDAAQAAGSLTDPTRRPDEVVEAEEIGRALDRAIATLDPKYREILVLRDVEGLTAPEVAQVVGIGVDAVKTRLHRARLVVRAEIAPRLGIPFAAEAGAAECPDVLAMLSRHLEDELSAGVCAEMERHLLGCPRCRGRCDSLRRTLEVCRSRGEASEVPPAVADAVRAALRAFVAKRT